MVLFSRVAVPILRLCCAPVGGVHRCVVCGGMLELPPSDIRWDDIPFERAVERVHFVVGVVLLALVFEWGNMQRESTV